MLSIKRVFSIHISKNKNQIKITLGFSPANMMYVVLTSVTILSVFL